MSAAVKEGYNAMSSFIYGNQLQMMGLGMQGGGAATPTPTIMGGDMNYYMQLGQQMMQKQMASQQQQIPQQQAPPMVAPDDEGSGFGSPQLTAGFDNNWLSQRLAAGSANGAKI